jgi:nucleoid-associated protein YgaU
MIRAWLVLPLLLLDACSAPRALPDRAPPYQAPRATTPATQQALAAAESRVAEARRLIPGYPGSDAALEQARRAAALANNPRAQSLAREAQTRAELALDGYYVSASARELQELYSVTGLSDAQLGRLREAEVALVRGEGARAHGLLQALNRELKEDRSHRVRSGESLWTIAARPEVYANGFLWPLIWDANRDRIRDPDVLYAGQVLRIRPNPTVDEVVRAVETARSRIGSRVRIGEIRGE